MQRYYQADKLVDHYKILHLLGQGIASRVYLAQDRYNHQQVVLKFPLDDVIGGAAVFERYTCEGEIGTVLDHPHIQCHLNLGEQRQEDYLVLEYLYGKTLREVMRGHAPQLLPPAKAIHLLLPVCEALVYVHTQGVIHRDIKPENIFQLDTGEIKVIDFGIALLKSRQRRRFRPQLFTSPIGTPAYMSPERLRGAAGDARADVYGVGVVLYELLCGRTPFQEHDGFALVNEHISHDPPSILQWNPDLPPALVTVVMRAIRRDPDKRYATMQNLLDDLRHLDKVTPMGYVPDPPAVGGQYRQALLVGLMALVVVFGIIAFGLLAQAVHHIAH
jgi:serine/threonine-protein kinase